jgi:hypothetical protein
MLKINVKEFSFFHLVGYFVQHLDRGGTARRKCQKLQVFHFLRLSPSRPPGCDCTNIGNDIEWTNTFEKKYGKKINSYQSPIIVWKQWRSLGIVCWLCFLEHYWHLQFEVRVEILPSHDRGAEKWHCYQSCSSKLCPRFKVIPVLRKCTWGWRHYFGQPLQALSGTQLPTWLLYFRRIRPCHAH